MEEISAEPMTRRRSQRIVMRVPLFINPVDTSGMAEWEPVETLVISAHGGMIRSHQGFPIGTTLDIRVRKTQRFTRARVVWTARRASGLAYEVGFEILEAPGFWQINFPEDR